MSRVRLADRIGPPLGARLALLLALTLALGACSSQSSGPRVRVDDPWVRPALSGNTAAVYFTIHNEGGAADRLVSVGVESAAAAEIHETVRQGDMVRMIPRTAGLEVPAGAELRLEPGATHVMLIDLESDLTIGDTLPLTLNFEKAGALVINAAVRKDAGTGEHEGDEHG